MNKKVKSSKSSHSQCENGKITKIATTKG